MSYLQPHEGIVGTDRAEPWLTLTPESVATRALIRELVSRVYLSGLMGTAPAALRAHRRASNPLPGDLVAEQSAQGRRDPDIILKSCGFLVAGPRAEWAHTDDEWGAVKAEWEGDPRPVEREAWYIQYGPSPEDVCRWTNARVVGAALELGAFGDAYPEGYQPLWRVS